MPGREEVPEELIESLLTDAEVGRDVEAIRNAVDPETLDEAVGELIHDIARSIRNQARQRIPEALENSPLGQIDWVRNAIRYVLDAPESDPTPVVGENDWDTPITVIARKGDVAAAAQELGYANNASAEALAFRQTLLDTLDPSGEGQREERRVDTPGTYKELLEQAGIHPETEQLRRLLQVYKGVNQRLAARLEDFEDTCPHRDMTLTGDGNMTCDRCDHIEPDPFFQNPHGSPATDPSKEEQIGDVLLDQANALALEDDDG